MPTGGRMDRRDSRGWRGGVSMVGAGRFPGEGADRTMGAGRAARGRQARDAPPTCGQLLQRYRVLAGLTQEELAGRAGYSGNYIGKLEQDQRELPAAAADRLATVLGLADQDRAALRAARERRQGGRGLPVRLLAGRDAEMAQIRQLLAGAGPPVLLLAGEPGMGKTRLLEEAASRGAAGGWGVARGGCLRRAQDAYAPLSGALEDALQRLPTGQRAEALRQAGRVDLLLPELALPGGPDPGEGGLTAGVQPEQQRRLLVSSAGRLLRAVAGPAGTLLILDDLHWAGPDAVDLLAALLAAAGSPPLRVIGAYRDSETPARLGEFVADLARASLVRVLPLGPLTDADAGQLILQLAPEGEQMPAVLPAIVRRAGGVPFFLVSYAEQVSDGGQGEAPLAVPWTVAQVIGQRVAALPGPAKELLSVAAVAGRVVPHALLAQVTGSDDEQVLQAVETALEARLLAEDGPDGYRFTHDLIRETVESGLSAARRRRLHRRIGQALEHQPGASAESLAFHFSQSGEDGTAAGVPGAGRGSGPATGGLRRRRGVLRRCGGPARGGRARRGGAGDREAGDGLARGRALRCGDHRAGGRAGGVPGGGRRRGRGPVTGRLAYTHYRRGTSHDALGELAVMAEGDPAPAPGAASPGALTWWGGLLLLLYAQGSYTKMVTLGRSLARAGRAAGDSKMHAIGTRVEGGGLICLGRLAEGTALMAAALPADPAAGDEGAAEGAALLSGAYLLMGEVDRCAALSERMLAAAERAGDQDLTAMHAVFLAGVCYVRGDWDRAATWSAGPGAPRRQFCAHGLACYRGAGLGPDPSRRMAAGPSVPGRLAAGRPVPEVCPWRTGGTDPPCQAESTGGPSAGRGCPPAPDNRRSPGPCRRRPELGLPRRSPVGAGRGPPGAERPGSRPDICRARRRPCAPDGSLAAGDLRAGSARDGSCPVTATITWPRAADPRRPGPRPGHALPLWPGPAAACPRPARPPATRPRRCAREVRPGTGHP